MTRMAIYLARGLRLDGLPDYERERELIRREVRSIVDRVLELGEGDAAVGTVRAFAAGVLDVPWSPNRQVASRVLPARDDEGYLRILDFAGIPMDADVVEEHRSRLARRARRDNLPMGYDLAVASVYELSEPLGVLLSDGWARKEPVREAAD
jgi:methylaspartate mutase epsilon subunit